MGLLMGCVLAEPWTGRARDFMQAAQNEGLFVLVAGANVLRVAPSLIIPKDDIDQGLARLQKAVEKICEAKGQPAG
jgi:acetylornithine/succinyldiaminopimelate/putrescine aminotransferase